MNSSITEKFEAQIIAEIKRLSGEVSELESMARVLGGQPPAPQARVDTGVAALAAAGGRRASVSGRRRKSKARVRGSKLGVADVATKILIDVPWLTEPELAEGVHKVLGVFGARCIPPLLKRWVEQGRVDVKKGKYAVSASALSAEHDILSSVARSEGAGGATMSAVLQDCCRSTQRAGVHYGTMWDMRSAGLLKTVGIRGGARWWLTPAGKARLSKGT